MRGYERIMERLLTHEWRRHRLSIEYAPEVIDHPDFDIPGVLVTSPTGRLMIVIEGEKELVGPIIEKAIEQMETLRQVPA